MPKYDRYLLSQFLTLFGFFSLVLVSVYWINRAVGLFDTLIANGHTAGIFVEFSLLTLPNVIRLVLPVSSFAAAVYVVNRMRSESELVIAQAAGLSPFRNARAVILFGLFVSVLTLGLSHIVSPISQGRLAERNAQIAAEANAALLGAGQFLHPSDGVTLFIGEIGTDGRLSQIFLDDRRDPARRATYTSQSALVAGRDGATFLVMLDGLAQTLNAETGQLETTFFDEYTLRIHSADSAAGAVALVGIAALPTPAILANFAGVAAETQMTPREIATELLERTAQGLQSFVAPILGFAAMMLGGFSRFSAWRQVTGAIVALIGYELAYRVTLDAVLGGALPVWAMLLPSLFFAALSLAVLRIAGGAGWRRRRAA